MFSYEVAELLLCTDATLPNVTDGRRSSIWTESSRYLRRQSSLYTENRDILCITGLKSERKKHNIKKEDREFSYRIKESE